MLYLGVACVDPPAPPPGSQVVISNYTSGHWVQFGDAVNYTCADNAYFASDRHMDYFNLTCYDNGTWEDPEVWEVCYKNDGTSCMR